MFCKKFILEDTVGSVSGPGVDTSKLTKPSAGTPRVNVISNVAVQQPSLEAGSNILRACLVDGIKGYTGLKGGVPPTTEKSEDLFNLLEGLGDNFISPESNDVEVEELQDIDGLSMEDFLDADPTTKEGSQEIIVNTDQSEQVISALNVSPRPGTPRSHFSQDFSRLPCVDSLPDILDSQPFYQEDKCPASPIIGRGKGKVVKEKIVKGGKGEKKMCKSLISNQYTSSSRPCSTQSTVFSQTEDKMTFGNFKVLYSEIVNKKRKYEIRGEESDRQMRSAVRLKEEVETQRKLGEDQLNNLHKEMESLKNAIVLKRAECRVNNEMVESLQDKVEKIGTIHQHNKDQLEKYSRKLNILRTVTK